MGAMDGVGQPSIEAIKIAQGKSGIALTVTSTFRPDAGYHGTGNAVDFSNGGDAGTPEMDRFAAWVASSYGTVSLEIIHVNMDGSTVEWKKGEKQATGFYGAGTLAGHHNHVHWAITNEGLGLKGLVGAASGMLSIGGMAVMGAGKVAGDVAKAIPGVSGVEQLVSTFDTIGKVFGHLLDPKFWIRMGEAGAGLLVAGIAILIIHRSMA